MIEELKSLRNVSLCQVLLRPGDQQEGVLPVCRVAAGGRGLEGEDPELSLVRCYLVRCYLVRSPGAAVSPAVTSYTTSSEYKHQRCSNEDAQMHSQNVYQLATNKVFVF